MNEAAKDGEFDARSAFDQDYIVCSLFVNEAAKDGEFDTRSVFDQDPNKEIEEELVEGDVGLLLLLHQIFFSPHALKEDWQCATPSLPLAQLAIRSIISSLIFAM